MMRVGPLCPIISRRHAMETLQVILSVPAFDQEALLALVSDWPLHGALQESDRVLLYLPPQAWTDARHDALAQWLTANGYDEVLEIRTEPARNWNRVWEETITPVRAGQFLLLPSWAEVPSAHRDATVLRIDPKMSFGTGHHATTRLMLRLLPEAVAPGDRVLDVGTGTGVLAIAAAQLGAAAALGVDVREAAIENATENCARNEVAPAVTLRTGSLDVVPETNFDAILANITREVLRNLLPAFREKMAPGGSLLLSGVFVRDRDTLLATAADHGFSLYQDATEDGWWAVVLQT